jgi:hypothetical protein
VKLFDDRLVTLEISVGEKKLTYNQDFYIIAAGQSFTNGLFGDCAIRIDNISKDDRDYLITKTSQWNDNRENALISLSVGRASFGTFQLFNGHGIASNPSQPPDIGLTIRSLTQAATLGIPNAFSAPTNVKLKDICQRVADDAGLVLDFQVKVNKSINNYRYTGALGKQIQRLNRLGVNAYIAQNSDTLIVTDIGAARDLPIAEINIDTGMIGVPQVNELGATVKVLINEERKIGEPVRITSKINPAVNGDYLVMNLGYEIASRDTPFYWILDLKRIGRTTLAG